MSVITYPVFSVVSFMLKHIALISMLCYYVSLHMLQLFAWCDICPLVILNYQTVEMLMLVEVQYKVWFFNM
jgi:putative effector of murein hydrolase